MMMTGITMMTSGKNISLNLKNGGSIDDTSGSLQVDDEVKISTKNICQADDGEYP